jgi:hypothetical protein
VVGSRGEVKTASAMLGPGFSGLGGIEGNDKLAGGVNRVGGKAEGNTMETMPGRERWVGFPRAEGVERELRLRDEIRPAVVRERDVDRRQDRDDVIFGGTNGSFRRWLRGGTYS